MLDIRDPKPEDEGVWRELWAGYNRFYEATVPEEATAGTWARILDPGSAIFCRLAVRDGAVVGFANCVVHPSTWSTLSSCYLEDLFVALDARGTGAGRALIQDLIDQGRAKGWRRVYWHTRQDNAVARRLYDRFAPADGFVRYVINLT